MKKIILKRDTKDSDVVFAVINGIRLGAYIEDEGIVLNNELINKICLDEKQKEKTKNWVLEALNDYDFNGISSKYFES